jgi:hypothetical protein
MLAAIRRYLWRVLCGLDCFLNVVTYRLPGQFLTESARLQRGL